MRRLGPWGGRRLTTVLAVLLLAALTLPLLRSGLFDFTPPQGMVERPCERAAELRSGFIAELLRSPKERERLRDWAGLCRFRADNARLLAEGARPRVVMIGDSLTAFWRDQDPGFFGEGIVDRGIAGQTSAQILLRFEQDVVALRPRSVHILAGMNDIAGNTGLTRPEDFQANIRAMVAIAQANDIAVILGNLPPAREFFWRKGIEPRPRIAELNRWLRGFAAERGLAFADYHAVLAGPDGLPQPRFGPDGVHLTREAYAAIRPVAEAAFQAADAAESER